MVLRRVQGVWVVQTLLEKSAEGSGNQRGRSVRVFGLSAYSRKEVEVGDRGGSDSGSVVDVKPVRRTETGDTKTIAPRSGLEERREGDPVREIKPGPTSHSRSSSPTGPPDPVPPEKKRPDPGPNPGTGDTQGVDSRPPRGRGVLGS